MNSIITIDDTDYEVIDLDGSEDAVSNACNKGQSQCSAYQGKSTSSSKRRNENDVILDYEAMNNCSTPKRGKHAIEVLEEEPIFKVIFRDENVSGKYRERIKTFLEELLLSNHESPKKVTEGSCDLTLEIWDSDVGSMNQTINITTESDESQDINYGAMFTVDTQPSSKDDLDVPTYGKKYERAFEKLSTEEESECLEKYASKLVCFNCSANHKLQDCPEPKSRENIRKNRKIFNKTAVPKGVRYHLDEDQRFGHIIPGQISNSLRNALGLGKHDLPMHIYRMRILGYPPGWLEEARLQHSGITLFNSDGVAEWDEDCESGEIFDIGDRDKYDIKKIFDFPGFNVPPPPGIYDDQQQFWTPQLQATHSKQTMLFMLQGKKAVEGYKRKKMKKSNLPQNDNPDTTPSNMDIEDDNRGEHYVLEYMPVNGQFPPPLPQITSEKTEILPPPPPLPPLSIPHLPPSCSSSTLEDGNSASQELRSPESPGDGTSPSSRTNSPSLSSLENMKNRLLLELEDSSSQSNPEVPVKNCTSAAEISDTASPLLSNTGTPKVKQTNSDHSTPGSANRGSIKSIDLGTPILQSNSPYSRLPSSEKFSKDICDVINFENLPDSTGKYEQMTGVLQKVRNVLAKIHQES